MNIRNGEDIINVVSLKWEDSKGKYIPLGSFHETLIAREVINIFSQIWTDWMDNVSLAKEASSTEVYRTMVDNALYTIDQWYKAGRYKSPLDMTYVSNAMVGYLWDYFKMGDLYDEADDYFGKVIC